MGKTRKICPDRKWEKIVEKYPQKWKIGPIFHFFGICLPFFPIFDWGKFSAFFPFFSHFGRSARFPLCSRPARLQCFTPNVPQPPGCGVDPIQWGLGFYALQPRATPMVSPPWGQSMKFKVRAPSDRFIWHFLASGEAGKALPVIFHHWWWLNN